MGKVAKFATKVCFRPQPCLTSRLLAIEQQKSPRGNPKSVKSASIFLTTLFSSLAQK